MPTKLDAFFRADDNDGFRLYLLHEPSAGQVTGALLFVHGWAEEMNKCRHVMAAMARALAEQGWVSLLIDLRGCGDSSGDFGDTSWHDWIDDVVSGAAWLRKRYPAAPFWLGGLRAGALLAAQAAGRLETAPNLLFVQPVLQGRQHLQQFMRLADAARWAGGASAPSSSDLRTMVASGKSIDVGGYRISPGLAEGLTSASLDAPATRSPGRVCWVDVSPRAPAHPAPGSVSLAARWRAEGWSVDHDVIVAPPFWQTTEIEDAPALPLAVASHLARWPA